MLAMWITSNAVESFSADTREKYKDVYLVIYIGYHWVYHVQNKMRKKRINRHQIKEI